MNRRPHPGSPEPSPALRARFADRAWSVSYQYDAEAITYRLAGPRDTLFLKLQRRGHYPDLRQEAERMRWASNHVAVPRVLEYGSNGRTEWLLTEALPGTNATLAPWSTSPERLVRTLAAGLRRFHAQPVEACPFDFRLDAALAHVRRRVEENRFTRGSIFHDEFAHLSPGEALEILETSRPAEEAAVVCHGDYCLPNVLIDDWEITGYVDLGELGVADRWWDLAVATWSVTWNLGAGLEDAFLTEYGVERDDERTGFYRLLYDLAS